MNKKQKKKNAKRSQRWKISIIRCVELLRAYAIRSGKRWRRLCGLCKLFSCNENDWCEISTGNKLFTSSDHKNRFSARRTQNRNRFSCGLAAHYTRCTRVSFSPFEVEARSRFLSVILTFNKSGIYHVARDKCRLRFCDIAANHLQLRPPAEWFLCIFDEIHAVIAPHSVAMNGNYFRYTETAPSEHPNIRWKMLLLLLLLFASVWSEMITRQRHKDQFMFYKSHSVGYFQWNEMAKQDATDAPCVIMFTVMESWKMENTMTAFESNSDTTHFIWFNVTFRLFIVRPGRLGSKPAPAARSHAFSHF